MPVFINKFIKMFLIYLISYPRYWVTRFIIIPKKKIAFDNTLIPKVPCLFIINVILSSALKNNIFSCECQLLGHFLSPQKV